MLDVDTLLEKTFLAQAEYHTIVSSTNDHARTCPLGQGETPRLIVADTQTAGRGRDQNVWWTGPRSLAFSIVLDNHSLPLQNDPQRRIMIALVAGIAVIEAIASPKVSGDACRRGMDDRKTSSLDEKSTLEIGLNWPNDVFIDDKKLCGILVEIPRDGRIIVGIGINTNDRATDAPPELVDRITTLRDLTDREYDHTALLIEILLRFEQWQATLLDDPTGVGQRADELCLQHGKQLAIDPGNGQILTGRCLGIAPDGAIRLDTPDGPRPHYSGRLI